MAGVLVGAVLGIWLSASGARAQPALHSYGLVIGSNRGGKGQAELSFAERDALRVAALLSELGRTPREHIERLSEPSASEVERALVRLREKLEAHARAGEQAQVLFYYSGHARSHALSLGAEELPLSSLREALLSLPSTLTVVVLDACQSGAFSGVKGAARAADFSISSVHDLQSSGVAVMASSTGTELSQESRELGSSYFTHHLLVALRGAGDVDRNGRVSLDEAYRYAYEHTLADTARTQVGSQHATLETELTGRGDVPLTYPIDADAQLAFPAELEGRVLVQQEKQGPVMAEVVKVKGAQLLLALPSGSYDVLVRDDTGARSCRVPLARGQVHALALASCQNIALQLQQAKEERGEPRPPTRATREGWFLELGLSVNLSLNDDYTRTLQEFGYQHDNSSVFGCDATVGMFLHRYVGLLARFDTLGREDYSRALPGSNRLGTFDWIGGTMMLGARLRVPIARHWLVAFAEVDGGLAWASSRLTLADQGAAVSEGNRQKHRALALRGLAGLTVGFTPHFGMYLAAGWTYAPLLENELGQRHDVGGLAVVQGLRLNAVKGWW